ncbi:hypothetical protein [Modestobacter sp. SYSU DS0875]
MSVSTEVVERRRAGRSVVPVPADVLGAREPADDGAGGRPPQWRRPGLWAFPVYLLLQVAQLLVLRAVAPRFFWLDDAQLQFTPMSWWLGNNFSGGMPPLMDPDQGMSANLTADMQYGVLDVIRWPFLLLAGQQGDLQFLATAQAWLAICVLGTASLFVLLNHRVHPALAIAGALGASTGGFLVWWGSAWSALMWSVAALVWLWAALTSRRWYAPIGVGLALAAVICAGNPYILPLVPVLLLAQLAERWRTDGRAVLRDRWTLATVVAVVAGVAFSVPTLVNALDVAQWMWRPHPEYTVASAGGSLNLLDIVVGGSTQLTDRNVPMLSTLLFALPMLALVDWRRAVGRPGVLTAGALWVVSLALTQLPTYVFGFRYPFRLLAVVQVAFALLALLAFARARCVTRHRLLVAGALVLLQAALAVSRAPVLWRYHVLNAVLVALAVAALVLLFASPAARSWTAGRRWLRPLAATGVVLLALTPLLVQLRVEQVVQFRVEEYVTGPDDSVDLYRPMTNGYDVGTTVAEFRDNAYAADASLTVWPFGAFNDGNDRGWGRGVLGGNANLPADSRVGYGSLAVWPKGVQEHVKADYANGLAHAQPGLMQVPDGVDVPWVDLLSGNRVLLGIEDSVPDDVAEYFADTWTLVGEQDGWQEYERPDPLPGRVTSVDDVTVAAAGPEDGLAHLGEPMETYTVSTGDSAGRLVFRTAYWNGFSATLDGEPVPVSAFDGATLQVEVPGGVTDGRLEISFAPIGARLLPYCAVGAALVLLLSPLPVLLGRRRGRNAD